MPDVVVAAAPERSPHKAGGWFGMMALIVTEAALFFYLLMSYYYFVLWSHGGFVPNALPTFELSAPNTVILLLSSGAVWWGEKGASKSSLRQETLGLLGAIVLGTIFVGIQLVEWTHKSFHFNQTTYSAIYFTITGFHMVHVVVGLVALAVALIWSRLEYRRNGTGKSSVAIAAVYWHFVDVVWLAVFFTLYVTPHMGAR
jgi:heme/copper-type cytochrome/quinol oxidase subunit 3